MWHTLSIEELFEKLNSSKDGLNKEDVNKRLSEYGSNILPKAKERTIMKVFISQFINPIVIILIIAAIVSFLIGEVVDGTFIVIIVLMDAFLGTFQEWKAEKSASALHDMIKVIATVKRDNKKIEINSENLVPGDIVYIETGHKISADMRIIESQNLSIDEAFLTGESIAEDKFAGNLNKDIKVSERTNMLYAGSTVLRGRAIALVVETGSNTEIGEIASHVINSGDTKTPLMIRMEKFTRQISILLAIIAVVLTFVLHLKGYANDEIFFVVVALSISAIPEGLPVCLTIALSIATNRMAKKNVIVRKLNAVESLGSCTVIASDKTGTLTLNEQTVKKIVLADNTEYDVAGTGYNAESIVTRTPNKLLNLLGKDVALNNEGRLIKENNIWVYGGDAMDVALLAFSYKINIDINSCKILTMIPYESENKYSACFYEEDDNHFATVKGSVETILDFCDMDNKEAILKQNENFAKEGYRVLAVAHKKILKKEQEYSNKDLTGLEFIGLISFLDPIRSDAKEALNKAKQAGVKVLLITGDHPLTAYNIAKKLDLIKNKNEVVTGEELEKVSKEDFDDFIKDKCVFSRTNPTQKLLIIEALKRNGEFVAVTGDGVNDAPALKSSNIGIAMGSGTEVAKETSSMIITDDSFMSIVSGIEEGRYAYDNIRKVIYMLLSCGVGEVLFFLLAILFDLPMPLVAIQLLWLNLITNGIQDVALAFEKGEKDVMTRKPRDPKESIFNRSLIHETSLAGLTIGIIIFLLWYYLINVRLLDLDHARTYILMAMVFMQNLHILNCRSEFHSAFKVPFKNNYFIILGIIGAISIHLLFTQVDFLSHILNTVPISLSSIISMFFVATPILIISEIYKTLKRKELNKWKK